jgi:hypothetical protein
MADDPVQLIPLLKTIRLFNGLDEAQITQVAQAAELILLAAEQNPVLDEEQGYPFFVIAEGKVSLTRSEGNQADEYILKNGDFFGADVLFLGGRDEYKITARIPAQLITIPTQRIRILIQTIPPLQANLNAQLRIYHLIRSPHFNWLSEDETILLIQRKHPAYIIITLLAPLGLAWLAFLVFIFGSLINVASFQLVVQWIAMGGFAFAALWAVWRVIDNYNDFYVVTDERVVWMERVIGIYDSRQETPLAVVKAGETKSSYTGRLFGFGDVITEALMGKVVFRNVANPGEIKDLIDQQRKLAMVRQTKADTQTMERAIRRKLDPSASPPPPAEGQPAEPAPDTDPTPSGLPAHVLSLVNYFQTRLEEGETITYRKHLFILVSMIWAPSLAAIGVTAGTAFFFYQSAKGYMTFAPPLTILFTGMLLLGGLGLWWLYTFVDWHNDIYRVTGDRIIDSERKPLGDEITKSAPLENILSMDYERIGFLGVVLNFGNVLINVGSESKFIFYGIHDPARAQSDIFNHIINFRHRKQLTDATQELERVSDWLAAYHHLSEEMQQSRNSPQN